jgi:CRP-like cAMP-binding protein
MEYLSMKSMRGKLSSFLLDQYKTNGKPTFLLPMKRHELADFLNVYRPSLSREMCRMRDEGVIDFNRSSIQIKDMESLKDMVE